MISQGEPVWSQLRNPTDLEGLLGPRLGVPTCSIPSGPLGARRSLLGRPGSSEVLLGPPRPF